MDNKLVFQSIMIIFLLISSGCGNQSEKKNQQEIVIASANPMSGDLQDAGDMKVKAIQLAFDEVNQEGGIKGQKITLLIEDDASSPKEANKIAQKLVINPNVIGIIGHWNSASMLATRHVYNNAGIPTLTDSINKLITDGTTPYIFRIVPTDKVEGEKIAEYFFEKLKLKKLAIIYVNNDYSKGLKEYFRERIQQLGGDITTIEVFLEGRTIDFSIELSKIRNSQPDGIFVAGYPKETAMIVRQARDKGIYIPIVGTDGISSMELIRFGGAAVEGIRFNGFFYEGMKGNRVEKFIQSFISRYGHPPDSTAALAYDSAQIMIAGIRKYGASRIGIYQYMNELKDYPGITGNITFDDHHDVDRNIMILTIKDGQIIQDEIQP